MSGKQSLVFVHGWGADSRCWSSLIEQLGSDYVCLCINLLDLGLEDYSDIPALLDALDRQIPAQSIGIGWSLGGMLLCQLQANKPNSLSAVVAFASNMQFARSSVWQSAMPRETYSDFYDNFVSSPAKTSRRFIALQAQGDVNRKQCAALLQDCNILNDSDVNHQAQLLSVLGDLDLSNALSQNQSACAFVFGSNDALVPIAASQDISKLFPRLEVNVVEGAAHAIPLTHADELAAIIKRWSSKNCDINAFQEQAYLRDKKRIAASFDKAADTYDQHAALQNDVAKRLCLWPMEIGARVADLGCGTGYCSEYLAKFASIEFLISIDLAPSMLKRCREKSAARFDSESWLLADLESLPLAPKSLDALVSSLAIQWCDSLVKVFSEAQRVLVEGGQFIFSSLGEKTLNELNSAWQLSDDQHVHVNRFQSSEAIMSAAEAQGFELQLFATEMHTLQYDDVYALMRDLKGIGAHNVNAGQNKALTGKRAFTKLAEVYETMRNESGALPASYEVHYWIFSVDKQHS